MTPTVIIGYVLFLMITHFYSDFVFQSHWMASNKSSNNVALTLHVSIYSAFFFLASFLVLPHLTLYQSIEFTGITFITHFITDHITSIITNKLWEKKDMHNFFVVIGLDQLIHHVTLIISFFYVIGII